MTQYDDSKHEDLRAINALGMHRDLGGCADCRVAPTPATRPGVEYVSKTPGELVPGEIAIGHGMLCLVTDAPTLSRAHAGGRTYWTETLVLNRTDVSSDSVPYGFTTPRLRNGYTDAEAVARGEHRWTFQGNDLASVAVLVHGPELPRWVVKRYRQGESAPSMSLSYRALTPEAALHEHFKAYRSGVADGETYAVKGLGRQDRFSTEAARTIARRYV